MTKKTLIGISGSVLIDKGGMFPGYKRCYVNEDYVNSIVNANGIPVIIPITQDPSVIASQVELLDGLVLSGGHDVNPLLYNQEPTTKLGEIMPERDTFDFKLLELSKEKQIPIMGICRGMQIINVYHGGSNYQDNSDNENTYIKHWQGHSPSLATHTITTHEGSKCREMFGEETTVNSFHHQSLNQIGKGLKVVATSKDGVVECIEHMDYPFMIGFQWHPEMMAGNDLKTLNMFKQFVHLCGESKFGRK